MTVVLNGSGLTLRFGGLTALEDCSIALEEREILGIMGPNGAGKSTLFNVLTGFLKPDSGAAQLRGRSLIGLRPHEIAGLGMVRSFQHPRIVRRLTTIENTLLALPGQNGEHLTGLLFRSTGARRQEREGRDRAMAILEKMDLGEEADKRAGSLSFGQQKLLALACCLATGSGVLLLDEPTSGVSPSMIERLVGVLTRLPSEGKSIMVIEHNATVTMSMCHRLVFMRVGRVVRQGSPAELGSDSGAIEAYLG